MSRLIEDNTAVASPGGFPTRGLEEFRPAATTAEDAACIPVFILSSNWSGSTWTGYVLGSHSRSAFLGEYYRNWNPAIRVPCPWCLSGGSDTCSVLHGVDAIAADDAFAFARSRTGRPVLVDSSKVVEWASRFSDSLPTARYVHLIRDPRGYLASERRRVPGIAHEASLGRWVEENTRIAEFLAAREPSSCRVAVYDHVARDPAAAFPELFAFLGLEWEEAALRYWTMPHHALAANGASDALLANRPCGSSVSFLATWDDGFYARSRQSAIFDRRWKQELPDDDQTAVRCSRAITALLGRLGLVLTADGILALDGADGSPPPNAQR